jgi:hypothetical protein
MVDFYWLEGRIEAKRASIKILTALSFTYPRSANFFSAAGSRGSPFAVRKAAPEHVSGQV